MAIDERSRHELFTRLEQVLGTDHATVLMEHLPPAGEGDVATTRDLDHLEAGLLAGFRAELIAHTRTMIFSMTTALVGAAGVAVAAARLL
jgi:hypothetical protein